MSFVPDIVPLETERLVLRAPVVGDFGHWADYFRSDRSRYEGGPFERRRGWEIWAGHVAGWVLRGYGPFGVARRDSGAYVGEVGIYHPESFAEPELGWFVVPEAEGQGYAAEAARAVMDWARDVLGWDRLVNIIDPANRRSVDLGLRLGGVIDPNAKGQDPGDVVIVHDLRRLI